MTEGRRIEVTEGRRVEVPARRTPRRPWWWLAGLLLLGAPLALGTTEARAQEGSPSADQEADTTITIRSEGSALQFIPDQIAATAGTRVRIRYVNGGTLPHNIVFVKDEADIDMLGQAAFGAADTGYVPLRHEDRMYAHSALAAPGETVEIIVEVPPPGEYFFVCLYAGHYNMMYGTLRSVP